MKFSELLRMLKKDGWYEIRQSGSHVIMRHPSKSNQISVPNHSSEEVKTGILRSILKDAEIETRKR
jgi:predicted RNA binding protein YcfA (HicA-like mRNA interferase family)